MTEQQLWVTPKEAADYLGVSMATMYRYINEKENPVPSYKISSSSIKLSIKEIDEWIKGHTIEKK